MQGLDWEYVMFPKSLLTTNKLREPWGTALVGSVIGSGHC